MYHADLFLLLCSQLKAGRPCWPGPASADIPPPQRVCRPTWGRIFVICNSDAEVGEEEICPLALPEGSSNAGAMTVLATSSRCSHGEVERSSRSRSATSSRVRKEVACRRADCRLGSPCPLRLTLAQCCCRGSIWDPLLATAAPLSSTVEPPWALCASHFALVGARAKFVRSRAHEPGTVRTERGMQA